METNSDNNLVDVPLDDLVIDESDNARVNYDEIDTLAATIKADGLISPPTAVEGEDGKLRLIAGFRRARAAKLAGLDRIPVVVRRNINRKGALFIQLAENVYRTDLTTYETAWSLKRIQDECNMTREELANRLHRSLSWLSNYLGLFDLPPEVIEMAKEDKLAVSHVRFLHSQMKYLDTAALIALAEQVQNYNQAQLDSKRAELEKSRRAPPQEEAKPVRVVETKATEELAQADDAQDSDAEHDDEELEQEDEDETEEEEEQEEELNFDPDARRRARVADDADVEEDEEDAQFAREPSEVAEAIKRLNRRGAKITSPTATAKLVGMVEALQWILGDDSVEF